MHTYTISRERERGRDRERGREGGREGEREASALPAGATLPGALTPGCPSRSLALSVLLGLCVCYGQFSN